MHSSPITQIYWDQSISPIGWLAPNQQLKPTKTAHLCTHGCEPETIRPVQTNE